jgi:hypothetical protein
MVVGGFYRIRSHPDSLLSAHYGGEKMNGPVSPLGTVEAISYILQQIKCVRFTHAEYRTSHIYRTLGEIPLYDRSAGYGVIRRAGCPFRGLC